MKLIYNGFDFGQLGKVVLASEKGEAWPKEAPANYRRTVTARVLTNQPGYVENFALIAQARAALQVTNGLLQFTDDGEQALIQRQVTVLGHNWPEQPNAWGNYHQVLEFDFEYSEPLGVDQSGTVNGGLTATAVNGLRVTLTGVEGCKYMLQTERYDPLRPHRRMADNRIELRGKHRASAALTQAQRRAALLAEMGTYQAVLRTDAEVVLNYQTVAVNQNVRVENFTAEVDQANWVINWSLSVRFTDFPSEAGYAQCEFTIDRREDKALGTQVVTLTGAVAASTELAAANKWRAVRASALGTPANYAPLRTDARPEQLNVVDGATFLKISYEEEWQKIQENLLAWEMRSSDGEETQTGMLPRTLSGSVTATGDDEVTAYATAVAKAKELGADKYPILRSSRLEWVSRQRLTGDDGFGNVLVTVEFNYTYEVKGKRVYYQVNTRFVIDTWGQDTTQVSGFIAAENGLAITGVYQDQILSLYAGKLLRQHEFGFGQEALGGLDAQGAATTEYATQWLRGDFSFTVLEPKGAASIRYEMEVGKDYVGNLLTTRISGTVYAANGDVIAAPTGQAEDPATVYLEAFLTALTAGLSLGTKRSSRRSAAVEKAGTLQPNAKFQGPDRSNFTGLTFEEEWAGPLTGNAAILKCSLREAIQSSGSRVVPQATAESTTVIQVCGQVEGSRQVSGSVTGTTQAACEGWIKKQKTVPLPSGVTVSGGRGVTPLQVTFNTVFIDNLPGDLGWLGTGLRPDGTKVQMVEAEFSFTEYYEQLGGGGWS